MKDEENSEWACRQGGAGRRVQAGACKQEVEASGCRQWGIGRRESAGKGVQKKEKARECKQRGASKVVEGRVGKGNTS